MALTLNNYSRFNSTYGILARMIGSAPLDSSSFLYLYSSAATYSIAAAASSNGRLVSEQLINLGSFIISENSIRLSAGSASITPTASGTVAWAAFYNTSNAKTIITDSVSVFGGDGIIQLSSLNLTNGVPIMASMSLSLTTV